MTFNHKLVNDFLEAIFPLPDEFGVVVFDDGGSPEEPINFLSIERAVFDVDPYAKVYFGISKLVITSPNLDNIVIKIPFNGTFSEDEDTGELIWDEFRWANSSDSSDYCLAEYEKFKKLKTYGLDCFVAKTLFYKTIDGVRIFIQEAVTPDLDFCSFEKIPSSQKSRTLAKQWQSEDKFSMDFEWIARCIDVYGESKVKRFLSYCENIDLDILEDMHDGNYGYRDNLTPVILDYSNFRE